MARIVKSGLEYFPFDVDLFQDIRIRKLIKRQGGKAVTVYALLLCLIYKNGYYIQWDNELPFIGSEMSGFDEAYISEVIKTCLSLGLFSKNMYDTERILTSKGIQERYCNIQRLCKRISRIDKFSLLHGPSQPDVPAEPAEPAAPVAPPVPAESDNDTPSAPAHSDDNARWLAEFFTDRHSESLRLLCKNFGLGIDDLPRLRALADAVVSEWELSQTPHRDYSDWSRHLISAMRIKNRDESTKTNINQPDTAPADYTFGGGFGGQDI